MKPRTIEAIIILLKATLNSMSPQDADNVVKGVIAVLEGELISSQTNGTQVSGRVFEI